MCDACGKTIAEHTPALMVQVIVATDPASGVDYYPDEIDGEVSDFLAAAFRTTPGIGGARLTYGASCFDARVTPDSGEVDRLKTCRAVRRVKDLPAAPDRPFTLGDTRARRMLAENEARREERAARMASRAERMAAMLARGKDRGKDRPAREPKGNR
jgi:hypothetical protein